ncbi:MAG: penicillin-insensitive murein endopeptidase, partial [Pseudomonadota bacterium]
MAADSPWEVFSTPTDHSPRSVGEYTNGCLLGGRELAAEGTGYQVVRLSRQRHFAHPLMVSYLEDLGEKVSRAGLGKMLVGDVAMARGGPFEQGHRSHQTGLDADIWLRLDLPALSQAAREDLETPVMVDHTQFRVDPTRWQPRHAELLRLAAGDPRVARIFVHPAIKQALCDTAGQERAWLRRVRPWFGHDAHFHVRLRCPRSDGSCEDQEEPPAGDGCGAELASWHPRNRPETVPPPRREKPPLPGQCQEILN